MTETNTLLKEIDNEVAKHHLEACSNDFFEEDLVLYSNDSSKEEREEEEEEEEEDYNVTSIEYLKSRNQPPLSSVSNINYHSEKDIKPFFKNSIPAKAYLNLIVCSAVLFICLSFLTHRATIYYNSVDIPYAISISIGAEFILCVLSFWNSLDRNKFSKFLLIAFSFYQISIICLGGLISYKNTSQIEDKDLAAHNLQLANLAKRDEVNSKVLELHVTGVEYLKSGSKTEIDMQSKKRIISDKEKGTIALNKKLANDLRKEAKNLSSLINSQSGNADKMTKLILSKPVSSNIDLWGYTINMKSSSVLSVILLSLICIFINIYSSKRIVLCLESIKTKKR